MKTSKFSDFKVIATPIDNGLSMSLVIYTINEVKAIELAKKELQFAYGSEMAEHFTLKIK